VATLRVFSIRVFVNKENAAMKKMLALLFAGALVCSLSFAQAPAATDKPAETSKTEKKEVKAHQKHVKAHKKHAKKMAKEQAKQEKTEQKAAEPAK
jgi:hypothetical protein